MPKRPSVPVLGDALDRLLAACESPLERALVLVLADTGARVGEAVALEWSDIDLEGRALAISRQHGNRPPKYGAARRVGLSTRLGEALHALEDDRVGRVLPWTDRHARRVLTRIARHAGIAAPVRPHGLRHGFAVRVLEAADGDLLTVRDALGHLSVGTTASYLRSAGEHVLEATRRLG
jgi:integrase